MQWRAVCELLRDYYCFKLRNRSQCGAIIQCDIFKIHNFVENNYQYDTSELLEKHKALT